MTQSSLNPRTRGHAAIAQWDMTTEAVSAYDALLADVARIQSRMQAIQAMEAKWATARQYIAAQAAANPGDAEWQAMLAKDAAAYAEYLDLKARAEYVSAQASAALTVSPIPV